MQLVEPSFFDGSEATEAWGRFQSKDFRRAVSAAYDLRSRYVHTGKSFGVWVFLRVGGAIADVQAGRPVIGDRQFEKLLVRAPTYAGLERIIRHCLLNFAQMNGAYVEPER